MKDGEPGCQLRYFSSLDPGLELDYANTYPFNEPLECMKSLVLQIQNFRIFMTSGNNTMSERSPGEVPVLTDVLTVLSSTQ